MAKIDEYKHPQWQKMRLAALERSRFQCMKCGESDKTLQVHHKRYPKGKVWECDLNDLSVLCEPCHKQVEDLVLYCRQYGDQICLSFENIFAGCTPIDLLQMVVSHDSGQLSARADGCFSVSICGIVRAHQLEESEDENSDD